MLVIRAEQMRVFAAAATEGFYLRLEEHVRTCWAHELSGQTPNQIRESIDRWLSWAQGYGMRAERDIVRCLDAGFLMGEGFEERADAKWAREILRAPELSPSSKALRIWQRAKQEYLKSANCGGR